MPLARRRPLRRHARSTTTTASSASRRSRRSRPPMPGDPDHMPGVDGHLRLHRPAHVRAALPGRDPARQRPRLRQEHHSRHDRRRTRSSATASATRTARPTPYWRDVGTLDAYYQANMDLIEVDPVLNLYDRDWPIRTHQPQLPPPKFVFRDEGSGDHGRRGEAHDSMVCQGCIISRRPRPPQHPVAERARQQLRPGRGLDPVRAAWTSAGTAASAGRSSTRT